MARTDFSMALRRWHSFAQLNSFDPSCKGTYNTHDTLRDEPTFVSSVANGKRFVVGQGCDKINIVHVYGGTPYDMGFALGSLMAEDLKQIIPEYFAYLDQRVEQLIKTLPPVQYETARLLLHRPCL